VEFRRRPRAPWWRRRLGTGPTRATDRRRTSARRSSLLSGPLQRDVAHRTSLPAIPTAGVEAAAGPMPRPPRGRIPRSGVAPPALRTPLRGELHPTVVRVTGAVTSRNGCRPVALSLAPGLRQHSRQRGPIARRVLRPAVTEPGAQLRIDVPQIPIARVDRLVRPRAGRTPAIEDLAPLHPLHETLPRRLVRGPVHRVAVAIAITAHRGSADRGGLSGSGGEIGESGGSGGGVWAGDSSPPCPGAPGSSPKPPRPHASWGWAVGLPFALLGCVHHVPPLSIVKPPRVVFLGVKPQWPGSRVPSGGGRAGQRARPVPARLAAAMGVATGRRDRRPSGGRARQAEPDQRD
jgi:hypothetical protein